MKTNYGLLVAVAGAAGFWLAVAAAVYLAVR